MNRCIEREIINNAMSKTVIERYFMEGSVITVSDTAYARSLDGIVIIDAGEVDQLVLGVLKIIF